MKIKNLFLISILFLTANLYAQHKQSFVKEYLVEGTDTLKLRVLYPKDFKKTESYPLVVFLHGAGERGNDNEKQLVHGSQLFVDSIQKYPAIVVFPQCKENDYWANAEVDRTTKPITLQFPKERKPTKSMHLVVRYLDELVKNNYVNKNQIYLGGLSMGGMGTFELLGRKPHMFAAAFAICGGGNTELAEKYAKNTPMWIFHGAEDDVVDPRLSVEMVSALMKYGAKPNFNLYRNTNHNSWDAAFAEPELLSWLFSNKKKN
ncbi:prolyl oligopeptidase family serine peptidase [Aureibaculum sp. 2210JD6-5]|uniref:carboxylesterase family protein n=1 Tax=Aureibaculum sp. 2210JD6-5 TaxID=3103957 RepID=UPI002AAE4828|nr:alpha/beta hydrolase-fold protein [Aureibaculum sp. 2210JD6-5]MDY7394326.1 prolyl oligopeptidase family serine peptidase [Aureibaculum sp. 2210JD6-5]